MTVNNGAATITSISRNEIEVRNYGPFSTSGKKLNALTVYEDYENENYTGYEDAHTVRFNESVDNYASVGDDHINETNTLVGSIQSINTNYIPSSSRPP